mmetsp:Transcript_136785/g.266055  ORF Transcript_136785/g.266055 Transcript_136785/m.266055 type:complete len:205 (-) Transcript_136785:639-1253(-)
MEPETSTSTMAFEPSLHSRGGTLFLAASETAISNASLYLLRSSFVGGFRHTLRFFMIFFASLPVPTAFSSSMKSASPAASFASFSSVASSKSMASNADKNRTGICFEFATCCADFNLQRMDSCALPLTPAMSMFRRLRSMAMKGSDLDLIRSSQTSAVLPFSDNCVSQVFGTGMRNFSAARSGSKFLVPPKSNPIILNSSSVIG